MKISIFGLGYVGTVAAACLADRGHDVVGVDPNSTKLELLSRGQPPLVEPGIEEIICSAVQSKKLTVTDDPNIAVAHSDLSMICVGTPSKQNGDLNLKYVDSVCREIGVALASKTTYHTIVVRSTILPGTMHDVVIPTLEATSKKKAGDDFGICHNPEFLREGSAVFDYNHPPKTVIGKYDDISAERLASLYDHLDAPLFQVPLGVSELVKYADNVWHATKVCFANEIGAISKALQIDSHQVMDIFCHDTKLNLSEYYLKPGFAFGGSCLPKDVRALSYKSKNLDLILPLLHSVMLSNQNHIEQALKLILSKQCKKIGVLGFSFKAGTDDMRESPVVEIVERLIGKGYDLRLFDKSVSTARLTGSNKDYIDGQIPHLSNLMVEDVHAILQHSELIIVGNKSPEFADALEQRNPGTLIIDLVRVTEKYEEWNDYHGICW